MHEPEGVFSDFPKPRAPRLAVLAEPLTVRKLWTGRSRRKAIYLTLETIDGRNVLDVRLWRIDGTGRMQPAHGFTTDLHRAPELAAAVGAAHRRAIDLNLIEERGGAR